MSGFSAEAMELLSTQGQTIVLMLDQSKMIDGFEVLMVSLRTKERAIPILWEVAATSGVIGFEVQSRLLHAVANMIPGGTKVILMADRFYGTDAFRLQSRLTYITQSHYLSNKNTKTMAMPKNRQVLRMIYSMYY